MGESLLDLSNLRTHVRAMHKDRKVAPRTPLKDLARLHAQWHHLSSYGDKKKGAGHRHGGHVISLQFGPVWSVHPEGYFTGTMVDEPEVTGEMLHDADQVRLRKDRDRVAARRAREKGGAAKS